MLFDSLDSLENAVNFLLLIIVTFVIAMEESAQIVVDKFLQVLELNAFRILEIAGIWFTNDKVCSI